MLNNIAYYNPSSEKKIGDHLYKTPLDGLYYLEAIKYNDERGFFSEFAQIPSLETILDKPFQIKQINIARSLKNVVRGMHAEGWNKLVTVVTGTIFSALTDIRPNSPSFKKTEYFKLSYDETENAANGLFISKGIANSICVLQEPVTYVYLVDKLYQERNPQDNLSISIFDPDLAINWPIPKNEMIISERDQQALSLNKILQKK